MKTDRKIFQAFNLKRCNKGTDENVYVPIKKTVLPKGRLSFNETWINIRKELLKLK